MRKNKLKILITGASGFLGSALARHFRLQNHDVSLLLRPTSRLERLGDLAAEFYIGRCITDDEIAAFVEHVQPDVVLHTACMYGRQGETFLQLVDTNVRLGLNIMQTLQCIGRSATFINTGTVLAPDVSPYAMSKQHFAQCGRLMVTQDAASHLRFINVLLQHMYGPGDDTSKFTTHVLHVCHRHQPELRLTLGEQRRDFIYIEDVVSAYSTLIHAQHQFEATIDIEVGSGVALTVREFVETAHRLTGSRTTLRFGALPYRANEPMLCQANLADMGRLGWKPLCDLETGLKKTLELEVLA